MPQNKKNNDKESWKQIVAETRSNREQREKSYREKALKMYPWICGRCGREFSGKRLRELTVHHRDHNHDNNPPDGSNWELLCLYCHDNEHARDEVADAYESTVERQGKDDDAFTHNPFANLGALLDQKK